MYIERCSSAHRIDISPSLSIYIYIHTYISYISYISYVHTYIHTHCTQIYTYAQYPVFNPGRPFPAPGLQLLLDRQLSHPDSQNAYKHCSELARGCSATEPVTHGRWQSQSCPDQPTPKYANTVAASETLQSKVHPANAAKSRRARHGKILSRSLRCKQRQKQTRPAPILLFCCPATS